MPREITRLPDTYNKAVIPHLHQLLKDLHSHPYPVLPNPPTLSKRASVALIIRIRPHYNHWSDKNFELSGSSTSDKLDSFFSQDWVRHGDPEILFIKRAANVRDKWTGHIAFPGGRRDPDDKDDCETAIRETLEEVGLDLREESGYAIPIGGLSQAEISEAWGKNPLMIFCPYVFLITSPDLPALRLQPTEVASTHWVPTRSLLDPKFRTFWHQDVSQRTSRSTFGAVNAITRCLTGKMLFAAVRLRPSESKFATESAEYSSLSPELLSHPDTDITVPLCFARRKLQKFEDTGETLLLWGLTLSVVGDFLDMLPPYDAIRQFVYPTFTAPDVRFFLWLFTYRYRRRMVKESEEALKKTIIPDPDEGSNTVLWTSEDGTPEKRYHGRVRAEMTGRRGKAAFALLPAYYPYIKPAVLAATAVKSAVLGGALVFAYRKWKL